MMHRGILLASVLCLLPILINSCGMLVHQDVSERALDSFQSNSSYPYKEVLKAHHGYVQAGSPFPDWGYLCKTEAGEASHWPPFIEAYKQYLEKTYEKGSEPYNRLVAFLFGIESHIEADIIWHWGKSTSTAGDQGYLRSMSHGASDCRDDWNSGSQKPNCHTDGDTGADFYLGGRGGTSWLEHSWRVPTKDLHKLYEQFGFPEESQLKILKCTSIMFIGSVLEQFFTSFVTYMYDKHTAFLTEELDLWYHGGLEDMATNVAWKWSELTNIIENHKKIKNAPHGKGPDCTVFGKEFLPTDFDKYAQLIGMVTTENEYGHHEFNFDGVTLKKNEELLINEMLKDLGITFTQEAAEDEQSKLTMKPTKKLIQSEKAHSYLGKALAIGDFNGDGRKELFVGAPGYANEGMSQQGAVYLTTLDSSKDFDGTSPHLIGPGDYSRFGFAMAALDLNKDGIDDLVVSAPAYGKGGVTDINDYYPKVYNGRILIYLGHKDTGISTNAEPDVEIRSRDETDPFFNLGQNLRVSECNGDGHPDLIVMSPVSQQGGDQRGHLAVFLNIDTTKKIHYIEDADFTKSGFKNYQWFGFDATCSKDNMVIIGAPGERLESGEQAVGAVYGYDIHSGELKLSLLSNEDQSKFGQSLQYNSARNLLAVGAPTRRTSKTYNVGAVYIYDLNIKNLEFGTPTTKILSKDRGARFGKTIHWVGNALIVAAPSLTSRFSFRVPNDQGKLYIYRDAHQLFGEVPTSKATETFQTADAGCRHGDTIRYSGSTLIVASPFCHNSFHGKQQRLAGNVYLFDMSSYAEVQKFLE